MHPQDLLQALPIGILRRPATESDLSQLEMNLGTRIPTELRELLLLSDGIDVPHFYDKPGRRIPAVYGSEEILRWTRFIRDEWNPLAERNHGREPPGFDLSRSIVFGNTGNGDYFGYVWDELGENAQLVFIDHETTDKDDIVGVRLLELLPDLDQFAEDRAAAGDEASKETHRDWLT
jgi:hypothetical protein